MVKAIYKWASIFGAKSLERKETFTVTMHVII